MDEEKALAGLERGIGDNWRPWAEVRPDDELTWDRELLEAVLAARMEAYDRRTAEIKEACDALPATITLDDGDSLDVAANTREAADQLWKELERSREAALGNVRAIGAFIHGYYKRKQDIVASGQTELQKGSPNVTAMIPALCKKITANRLLQEAKERREREAEALAREVEARRQREEAKRLRREEEAARQSAARKRNEELRAAAEAEAKRLEQQRVEAEREAHQREAEAMAARQSAEAKPAELTRFRSSYGATISTSARWRVDEASINRATLDFDKLRTHFTSTCLVSALNSYCKSGEHEIRGATFHEHRTVRN